MLDEWRKAFIIAFAVEMGIVDIVVVPVTVALVAVYCPKMRRLLSPVFTGIK